MTHSRQPRPRQAAVATRRRTRRAERQPAVDDVVEIWWDVDKTYYKGRLTRQLDTDMHFTMLYDDGETEDVNLHDEFWKFADADHAFRSPPASSDSDPELHHDDAHLQQRDNAPQLRHHASIGERPSAAASTQLPNLPNNSKLLAHQHAPLANNAAMRTTKPPSESFGKGKSKLKRTKKQAADKSAIVKRTSRASTATLPQSQNASTNLHTSTPLPPSHAAAHLADPVPLNKVPGSAVANMADNVQNLSSSNNHFSPSTQAVPVRMKLVKTADAKANHPNSNPAVVQKVFSGTKRKLPTEPSPPSPHQNRPDTESAANIEPAQHVYHVRQQHDVHQHRKTDTETNQIDKTIPSQPLPAGTSGNISNLSSPTRRRGVRRRIHSLADENSTDSSSSPNAPTKKVTPMSMGDAMEIDVNKDSQTRPMIGEARDHSIPLKVSLKRANLRGMTTSKDPNLRNAHISQSRMEVKQENVINDIRHGEAEQNGDVDDHASGSVLVGNEQNISVQANQMNNTDTEVIDSSKKSVSPLRVTNEDVETQLREEPRAKNSMNVPNLELISPVSGLPELDTCIDAAFGRRLDPVEKHLNNLTTEVQQIKSGFDSARQMFEGLVATKESDIKAVKVDMVSLDQKLGTVHDQIGALREDMKIFLTDNQSIKRDMAIVISFLRQQAQIQSQREQVAVANPVRSTAMPASRNVPPRQNGQLAVAAHVQPNVQSRTNVHHYAAPVVQRPVRNPVEYQQRPSPAVDAAHAPRQRRNPFPVQRPASVQNTRHAPVRSAQVAPQATSVPGQVHRVQQQRSHVSVQGTPTVTVREQPTGSQPASYAVTYGENRSRTEVFTYQVMELVARQVTVWLLETPHEYHKSGMSLETWAKRTSSTTYARIAPRLAMFRSYEHAKSTLSLSLSNGVVDVTWFMSPFENQCTERARRNYDAWDPPPNDEEWMAEMHLLKELAVGFHRTFQNYSHPESTVLEVSVLLTRRAARDYEEAGYRPILSLTNDAQRQHEAQVYNGQPRVTPISGWRPT